MASADFKIEITRDAVDIRLDAEAAPPREKLFGFLLITSLMFLAASTVLFLPGKHGSPSMWNDLVSNRFGFTFSVSSIAGFAIFWGLFTWQSFRYARAAWPSDETFHCDRVAITLSRVPWLDFKNKRWVTTVYTVSEVRHLRYAVLASAKNRSIWGIRFLARGRKWCLPGLEAPEAQRILQALEALGLDVPADPNLQKRVDEAKAAKFGDTSWLDTSWMDQAPPSSDKH